jgi:hypothetical protein
MHPESFATGEIDEEASIKGIKVGTGGSEGCIKRDG